MDPSELSRDNSNSDLEPLYSPEPEVHLRDYLYVILKRRWIVIAITIAALGISAVKNLRQQPRYSATAIVQISRGKLDPFHGVTTYDSWVDYAEFYPTQVSILKSYNLAYRVVESLELWKHRLFRKKDGGEPSPRELERLAGAIISMLEVSQKKDTQLMEVSFTTLDPELSAQLANTLVSQYISFNSKKETEIARESVSFLADQIERLESEIQENERLLREYSQRDDVLLMDQKEDIVFVQLKSLNQQLSSVEGELAAAEARYRSLEQASPTSLAEVQKDTRIQNLDRRRAQLQERIEELSSEFKQDWPELQRDKEALLQVEQRLGKEIGDVARKVVEAARIDYQSVLEREKLLQKAVDEKKQEAQRLNRLTADYVSVQAELDNKRKVLDQLLRRHSEMGMSAELGEGDLVNVRLVDEALVPEQPSGPNVRRGVMMGGMLGFSLAIGLVFFLNYWDTAVYTVEDLRRYVPLPFMGMVPRYEAEPVPTGNEGSSVKLIPSHQSRWKTWRRIAYKKDLGVTQSSLALAKESSTPSSSEASGQSSEVGERFKFIRGSILMSSPGKPPKVILIAGPEKNAGKTFVSCNLAASLAEMEKKVILIDADLRNPQIHRIFGVKNKEGLSNVLTGQADINGGCIADTPIPNVFLLSAGSSSPSPSELLSSEQMEHTLEECAKHFDFVLLDSAPLLPVFDSHALTTQCDATVMVVRSGKTSRDAVKTSLELVERVGGKVSGVVLNGVDAGDYSRSYYYGYRGYGYGYGYRTDRSDESVDKPA
jgi:capsular exopolysaccharide synthesis family protein